MSSFDIKIAKAGKLFIKNKSSNKAGDINIKFSKRHQQQMQKLFEELKIQ